MSEIISVDSDLACEDAYFGVSGLEGDIDFIDFGFGIELRKTYAHIVTDHILAYEKPKRPGVFMPSTWHATTHGGGVDINHQIFIPKEYKYGDFDSIQVAKMIIILMKLLCFPNITLMVMSNKPIETFKEEQSAAGVFAANLFGLKPSYFNLEVELVGSLSSNMDWVARNWQNALLLKNKHPEFELAIETYDNAQFIPNSAMVIVSIWGALEAIFSPHKAELVFRVSSNLAAFLEPRGPLRLDMQKKIVKLYGIRSAAAHGSAKHKSQDVFVTLDLLRKTLIRMIHFNQVPDKEMLENLLFVD